MKPLTRAGLAVLCCIALATVERPAQAADQKVTFAIPNLGITFAYAYIAQALGYWKDQGLDVDITYIDGAGTAKALIAGDIQFAGTSGVSTLLAAATHQPMIAIVNIHSQLNQELMLSPAAVKKTGLVPKTASEVERARALKGMTIIVDGGPITIPDGVLRHIAAEGGLDPDKDMTIAYLGDQAAVAKFESGQVDGLIATPPFSTIAQQDGGGVNWIAGDRGDLKDLDPFVYTTLSATKSYCEKSPDICTKFLTGVTRGIAFMKANPDKGLELIGPTYKNMDPNILKAGYDQQIKLLNPDGGKMSDAAFKTTQNFDVGAGMMKPEMALTSFEGAAYTNAYLK